MANPIIIELTEQIESFKRDCGKRAPSLRFDMDAKNYLAFHVEGNLNVLSRVTTFDKNNLDQFNMLANLGDYILKLRDKIKTDNALDDKNPLCIKLTKAAELVTKLKVELNADFHAQRSAEKLNAELAALKHNLPPNYHRGLNNLLQQMKLIMQQKNTTAINTLAGMMQKTLQAYYDIRTAPSITFIKQSSLDNPLGHALETFINNQMRDIGKEHGIIVPHVQHVVARGATVPSIQVLLAPEKKQTASL